MRKIIVHEFISLDGVIQAPGGDNEDTEGGFKYGGWTHAYWHDEIGARFFETMKDADTLLLGRKTWQIHSVFNTMDDPFANAMNEAKKVVVSRTLNSTDAWRNTSLIKENVVDEIRKLKEAQGKNILTDGSSELFKTLIEHSLIDEIQLHLYPVVLGSGKRLFPEGLHLDLELINSKALPTGVVFQHYQVKAK